MSFDPITFVAGELARGRRPALMVRADQGSLATYVQQELGRATVPDLFVDLSAPLSAFPSGATVDGKIILGQNRSGSLVGYFTPQAGREGDFRFGTTVSPTIGGGPGIRISQTENVTDLAAQMGGNNVNNEYNAALAVSVSAVAGSLAQPCAIYASVVGAPSGTDVCAINIGARHTGSGSAYGIYAEGRSDLTTSFAVGIEARASNYTNVPKSVSGTGQSESAGIWVTTAGYAQNAVGVQVGMVEEPAKWIYGMMVNRRAASIASFVSFGGVSAFYTQDEHQHGLNLYGGSYTGNAILLPNSTDVTGGINFGNDYVVFRDRPGGMQMPSRVGFGKLSVDPPTLPAAGTDAASVQALANDIRSMLINLGLAE